MNSNFIIGSLCTLFLSGCTLSGRTSPPPTPENNAVLLRADFQRQPVGLFTEAMLEREFQLENIQNNGFKELRATIARENSNRFLRITYTAKEFGPRRGGVQFRIPFTHPYNELYFSYRVRFDKKFDFVLGGKLPGLVGGTAPTGCISEKTGFSARNMWREGGAAVQYVYYPYKQSNCGDDFPYHLDNRPAVFTPGHWQTIEHHLVMNSPGEKNGVMQAWVDGKLVLDIRDFLFRDIGATYAIDALYFSSFFGGSSNIWAPQTPQVAEFDDFIVAEKPISH